MMRFFRECIVLCNEAGTFMKGELGSCVHLIIIGYDCGDLPAESRLAPVIAEQHTPPRIQIEGVNIRSVSQVNSQSKTVLLSSVHE